ncbi:MAG: SRPBCC domain-containing protein [Myxococcaceae bacterium]
MSLTLVARKSIRASPERLFELWTTPEHLHRWWGPKDVTCVGAEVDLRVGGRYRLGNRFPDGKVVWISGEFEEIRRPSQLCYSWRVEGTDGAPERVTVRFEPEDGATLVIVTHERIADEALRRGHAAGWEGCLDGLERYA